MKMKHILLFSISMLLVPISMMAQETIASKTDSVPKRVHKYGLRIGADLSKLARTAFEDGYTGFEVVGDLRLSKRFYAAAEFGNETREWDE